MNGHAFHREHRLRRAITLALARAGKEPFVWGRDDCLLWVADIHRAATGVDIAAPWRGRYASSDEARALAGGLGLATLAARRFADLGYGKIRRDAPLEPGDLGLACPAGQAPALVIFDGHMWLGRCDRGFSALPPGGDVPLAWRAPCPR